MKDVRREDTIGNDGKEGGRGGSGLAVMSAVTFVVKI